MDKPRDNKVLRILIAVFLVFTFALLGFATGAWLSAIFFVAPNAGLAGGAEVAFGGLIAAISFVVIAILMIRYFDNRKLSWITGCSTILLLAVLGFIFLNN